MKQDFELPQRFCRYCGSKIKFEMPIGDDHQREVCPTCGVVHYENPKVIAGAVIIHQRKVMLCKRAISPRYGKWTLPAGFMELGEHGSEAAKRETFEEAGTWVEKLSPFAIYTLLPVNQTYLMYFGEVDHVNFPGGIESLEVAFFDLDQIPWSELAFPVVAEILRKYIAYAEGTLESLPLVGEMTIDRFSPTISTNTYYH
jgi:ADP-ribose pyrophosphatase YjhB (NUDIX family)